jgi:hypothetical protein
MSRSNFALRLQPSLLEELRKSAEAEEGVAVNQLINVAVAFPAGPEWNLGACGTTEVVPYPEALVILTRKSVWATDQHPNPSKDRLDGPPSHPSGQSRVISPMSIATSNGSFSNW